MSQLPIRLTQTVQKGGCAAKIAASELRKILGKVKFPTAHAELLVDSSNFDDAGIYQMTPEIALVQTLDFFTPIVDSPYLFGSIAAANAMSDVYAMGGKVKTAMGILAFPLATMSSDVIVEVLQGASDKIAEADANFVGGHSIDDDTLKFGLSVTGLVHPQKIWTNAGAKPGDHLILTKPLGTGTLTAALKRGEWDEKALSEALQSMAKLNNIVQYLDSSELDAIHAATDITGFGLSGHAMQMAKASKVRFQIEFDRLPKFELALDSLKREFLTKAHHSNAQYTKDFSDFSNLSPLPQLLLHDPQTSGGLLLSVDPNVSSGLLQKIKTHFPAAAIIGQVRTMDGKYLGFD